MYFRLHTLKSEADVPQCNTVTITVKCHEVTYIKWPHFTNVKKYIVL